MTTLFANVRQDRAAQIVTRRFVLVGCVSAKLDHAAPAAELYTSPLFRKRREYAEATGDDWAIVSAQYGLVWPDQIIEPYDTTIDDLGRLYRRPQHMAESMWANGIACALRYEHGRPWGRFPGELIRDIVFELHAGERYARPLAKVLNDWLFEWRLNTPLAGIGIGKQLAWYGAVA